MIDMSHEALPRRSAVLKKGKAEFRMRCAGMIQLQTFEIVRRESPFGKYPVLYLDKIVGLPELLRIAEGIGLPVSAKNATVFPKGKMAKDFAGL
jgi:hypothetical protein